MAWDVSDQATGWFALRHAEPDQSEGRALVVRCQRRRRHLFDFAPTRRREIERFAIHVDVARTDDFPRFLIAWSWHNTKSTDPLWALMNCAERLGRKITEAEASAILEEASITRRRMKADNLGRFLGLNYEIREKLRITTIGAKNVPKRARRELRKRKDRLYQERKRRARGARPHSKSLSQTKPWQAINMSRRTWERHRNKVRDAKTSAAIFLSTSDEIASLAQLRKGLPRAVCDGHASIPPGGATMAVDDPASVYSQLPIELRLLALGLGDAQIFGLQIGVAA
jgi:hypothetical protein